jgi:hypothetical protein
MLCLDHAVPLTLSVSVCLLLIRWTCHSEVLCFICDFNTIQYLCLFFHSWIKGELLLCLDMFNCFQVERLARTDILVKDLYVENACLVAAVQRLEQHCHVLVQMTPDSTSVWIWLCLLQIWMHRVNEKEAVTKYFESKVLPKVSHK